MRRVLYLSVGALFCAALMFGFGRKDAFAEGIYPVYCYQDEDWGGVSQGFGVGAYTYSDIKNSIVGDDKMTALRIKPGYKVILYADPEFSGASREFTSDVFSLKDYNFNDVVSSMKIETVDPIDDTCIDITDLTGDLKAAILRKFAPRMWIAQGETYYPSSIEWAMNYLERYYDSSAGHYCLRTKTALNRPTDKLPVFYGNMQSARCYSFWTEKDFDNIDLSYWQYCPYNFGKVVWGMEFGDHVGDWEHVTVRLSKFEYEGRTYVKPTVICIPYHSKFNIYQWDEVDKVAGTDHIIVYSAKESHGMWKDPGSHMYLNIVISKLKDECSAGTPMDCWNILETYEFSALTHTGDGLGQTPWSTYFSTDYDNPDSNAVYRWGNPGSGSVFGQSILGDGPAGPERHEPLSDYVKLR